MHEKSSTDMHTDKYTGTQTGTQTHRHENAPWKRSDCWLAWKERYDARTAHDGSGKICWWATWCLLSPEGTSGNANTGTNASAANEVMDVTAVKRG